MNELFSLIVDTIYFMAGVVGTIIGLYFLGTAMIYFIKTYKERKES